MNSLQSMPVKIIAEIGVNHNADLDLARTMIAAAAESGADVIKFQTAIPELVQTADAKMAKYQIHNTGEEISQLEMSKKFHFPVETYSLLKDEVEKCGKIFMSTAFDLISLEYLASLGEKQYKIPSGEITNLPYLRKIGSLAESVIVSTGMATWKEVQDAVNVLLDCGVRKNDLVILQCNTEYPTPFEDVNLNTMVSMGRQLDVQYGYSDHTKGIEVAIAAVALGAKVIEKHFTIDNKLPGPDQKASLEPVEFSAMVRSIRNIEKSLGTHIKKTTPSELKNKAVARRSIYTAKNTRKGKIISMEDLIVLRPEKGLSPMNIDMLIGKKIRLDLPKHYPITLIDVE